MSRRSSKQSTYAEDPADEAVTRRLSKLSQFREEYPDTPDTIRSRTFSIVDPAAQEQELREWRDWSINILKIVMIFFVFISVLYTFSLFGAHLASKYTDAINNLFKKEMGEIAAYASPLSDSASSISASVSSCLKTDVFDALSNCAPFSTASSAASVVATEASSAFSVASITVNSA
jgi:hypothetical protein